MSSSFLKSTKIDFQPVLIFLLGPVFGVLFFFLFFFNPKPREGKNEEIVETLVENEKNEVEETETDKEVQQEGREYSVKGIVFKMQFVKEGEFYMGAQSNDPNGYNYDKNAYDDEKPVHKVKLSSFYMAETEVTQALWEAVMGYNPSCFKGENQPVENVEWDDCQTFIQVLNELTGEKFRLPTESEWEYAAKGGREYEYSGSDSLDEVGWYGNNSGKKTHPVKQKKPNVLGLYDMSGNVFEWCNDWDAQYDDGFMIDPQGPQKGKTHTCRGGSWNYDSLCSRVCFRSKHYPDRKNNHVGFRLAITCFKDQTIAYQERLLEQDRININSVAKLFLCLTWENVKDEGRLFYEKYYVVNPSMRIRANHIVFWANKVGENKYLNIYKDMETEQSDEERLKQLERLLKEAF